MFIYFFIQFTMLRNNKVKKNFLQNLNYLSPLFYLQSSFVVWSESFKPYDGVDKDETSDGCKSRSNDGKSLGQAIFKEFAKKVVRFIEDNHFRSFFKQCFVILYLINSELFFPLMKMSINFYIH